MRTERTSIPFTTALADVGPAARAHLLGLPYAQKFYRLLRYPGAIIYQYEIN